MGEYFMLASDGPLRLKAVSSSTRGSKATIRIEIETTDFEEMGYALNSLARLQRAQMPQKAKPRQRFLALPAPETDR